MSEDLPYDVLLKILHGLPVKSLIRFRCLSKSFNSLITSQDFFDSDLRFARSHPDSHPDSNKLIVRYLADTPGAERYILIVEDNDNNDSSSSEQIQDFEFPLRSRWGNFDFVGSANGLFCLHLGNNFHLWNPCIRKFITLPDPTPFSWFLGFGFDSRNNDYKVVKIARNKYEVAQPVEVYSVSERSWRVASVSCRARIARSPMHQQPASLNGALHFAVNDWGDAQSLAVLSFNLSDEVFRVISLPNGNFGSGANIGISVFNGLLSLLSYECQHESSRQCCSVWVMKEYDVVDSWIKLFTIELNMLHWKVLGFLKNGHVIVQNFGFFGSGFFSYDPKSEQVKKVGFHGSTKFSYADNYVRNLTFLTNQMM